MRKFRVYNRDTQEAQNVDGVEALSQLTGWPVEDIPTLRLFKYSEDQWTVTEFEPEEQQ